MAYAVTGTAGSDVLNQSSDTGPGTIVGLAGDDCIFTGSGLATVTGDSGNDTVVLKAGNTGTVNAGTENDSIGDGGTAVGAMQLFGGDGADTIWLTAATGAETIVGGNDSSDGNDSIGVGSGNDLLFGNGGNDFLNDVSGNDTYVGGFGNDTVVDNGGTSLIFGNQGNDFINTLEVSTVFGGLGNDTAHIDGGGIYFLNEGNDYLETTPVVAPVTVVGGNDSADGNDTLIVGGNGHIVFGNGGADIINIGNGAITGIGGQGNDCIFGGGGTFLVFGNEGNDTLGFGPAGALTIFGGQGNDSLFGHAGRDTLQGNEGNDSIRGDGGSISIDTISGGTGNDVFRYTTSGDDGNNAGGGGPVELITDLNWAEDRFDTPTQVTFAANTGAGTGANLSASANNAIAAAYALAGGGAAVVAAQFSFAGHTYLAVDNQNGGAGLTGQFDDANDLLIDITGVTGTIATGSFISPPVPSDVRLKRDIVRLGRLENGIGLYEYRYHWSDQRYVGVMAQEVATVAPGAVAPGPDGYLRVDYARLGLRLQTWEQWATANQRPG